MQRMKQDKVTSIYFQLKSIDFRPSHLDYRPLTKTQTRH